MFRNGAILLGNFLNWHHFSKNTVKLTLCHKPWRFDAIFLSCISFCIQKLRSYSKEEVSKHNTRNDCWIIIKDKVVVRNDHLPCLSMMHLIILYLVVAPGLWCHSLCGGTSWRRCHSKQCWCWFDRGLFWVCSFLCSLHSRACSAIAILNCPYIYIFKYCVFQKKIIRIGFY